MSNGGTEQAQSLLLESLEAIERLESQLAAARRADPVQVAIVAIGCRFPGAENPEAYWRLLSEGIDAIEPIPSDRHWAQAHPEQIRVRAGGFVPHLRDFDAEFFGISPREAQSLDPQQRLLLEVVWETIERSGTTAADLKGSRTGVFMGLCSNDFQHLLMRQGLASVDAYLSSGTCHSTASGRLSYWLGLRGPSIAIDTACSSSLVALHLARASIQAGECDQAFVGGVNRIIEPYVHANFTRAGMLAPDGRCKAFSADADGFVRAEGCGVVMLKRLDHAGRDGDRVLAVVSGSACNQDGRSAGLTVPNGPAQAELINAALADSGLRAADVDYVEAHGTGTRLGDPIEIESLGQVFAERPADHPVLVGSVKANIGHLEAAAGVAGVIKVVLALDAAHLPAQLHFARPSGEIDWARLPVQVVDAPRAWVRGARPRVAGVSSFGFSGTNAHVVLSDAPLQIHTSAQPVAPVPVLPVSARSGPALERLCREYVDRLHAMADADDEATHAFAAAAACRRDALPFRVVAVGRTPGDLARALQKAMPHARRAKTALRVAFLFSGQGGQFATMAAALVTADPAFASLLRTSCALADGHCDQDLYALLVDDRDGLLADTRFAQPAGLALQLALVGRFAQLGVEPVVCLGHSVGEIAALATAGVLCNVDAMRIACARGALMSAGMAPGAMVAVLESRENVSRWLAVDAGLELAAYNAPECQVIAGPSSAIDALLAALRSAGQAHARMQGHRAFHTRAVDAVREGLGDVFEGIALKPAQRTFISTCRATRLRTIDADYLMAQARAPVRFEEAVRALGEESVDLCVEIGPGTTLSGLVRRTLPQLSCIASSAGSERPDELPFFPALAQLWACGMPIDWAVWYGGRGPVVDLPLHPFERRRHWPAVATATAAHSEEGAPAVNFDACLARAGILSPTAQERRLLRRFHAALSDGDVLPHVLHALRWEPKICHDLPARHDAPAAREPESTDALEQYRRYEASLEQLAAAHVLELLRDTGLGAGSSSFETICSTLCCIPKLRPLMSRLLQIAMQAGFARVDQGQWSLVDTALASPPLAEKIRRFVADHGRRVEFRLLERCGAALAQVLAGTCNPVHVLFPDGSFDDAAELYREGPVLNALNRSLAEWLANYAGGLGAGAGIRVLEVGAGTGGTSTHLLPALCDLEAEYWFTDVGPAFVANARQTFSDTRGVNFAVYDVAMPSDGSIAGGRADVVVAANVLHATAGIGRSVENVVSQLKPGGWLALVEGTQRQAWVDLTFGLTDGWWGFQGDPERVDYPLLDVDAWTQLLTRRGFDHVQVVSGHPGSSQKLLLARLAPRVDHDARALVLLVGSATWAITRARHALEAGSGTASAAIEHVSPSDAATWLPALVARRARAEIHILVTEDDETDAASWCLVLRDVVRVAAERRDWHVRLWLASDRGAAGFGPTTHSVAAFARVASLELGHPGIFRTWVDGAVDTTWESAVRELSGATTARERRWSASGREIPRLHAIDPPLLDVRLSADARYVVTGGLGGVGLVVLRWMARQGARDLIVVGRHEAQTDAQQQVLADLAAHGVRVIVCTADLGERLDVAALFAQWRSEPREIRGILHLAGVIGEPTPIVELQPDDLHRVFGPKAAGAWNLHEFSAGLPLDFFLCFSSGASVWGFKGQAHYAAANGFVDGLVALRRERGLPASVINWGFLAPGGMTASAESQALLASYGVHPISDGEIVKIVGLAMHGRGCTTIAARNDWSQLGALLATAGEADLVAGLLHTVPREAAIATASTPQPLAGGGREFWRAQLATLSQRKQADLVGAHVLSALATVLGRGDPGRICVDDGFQALGVDSLMALDLRQRVEREFGLRVPATMIYDWPSPASLSAYLQQQLVGDGPHTVPAPTSPASASAPPPPGLDELEALLEQELRDVVE